MFEKIFFTVLRSIAIPYVFFLILSQGFLEEDIAWLAVSIALTFSVALSLLWQVFMLIPKAVLLKGRKIIYTFLVMAIEIASVVGFWYYYFSEYAS